jgi:GT2 family glycosyltransferase
MHEMSTRQFARPDEATVAVVVLTHNRVHLLRRCVENVLSRTSRATTEIVIWNNGSTDGTAAYLDSLTDARLAVIHHGKNIGQNAYARAFATTSADYLVELDDDVVAAPDEWDMTLLHAFRRLPTIGFLAADLEDDPHDTAADYRYRIRPHLYVPVEINGVELLEGPAGGGCAMTSRKVYDGVGGFRQNRRDIFWQEESAFIEDIKAAGYSAAVLAGLKVLHTGGPHYAAQSSEKDAYWARWNRSIARRTAVKRVLLRLPFVRRLNARRGWFVEPA